MAGLSYIELAGVHINAYETFYQQVDPAGTGRIAALEAAKFLKKSNLSDNILSKIWDLSDPNGLGYLDKQSFFVALKLVALAQNNNEIGIANLGFDLPSPVMGDLTILPGVESDWVIKPSEKAKYDILFESLKPVQGTLPSTKVKPVMMNSKLPLDVLGRVWDLSDIDRDGSLDRDEFALAMHLVYKALNNHPVPSILPPELIPHSKVKKMFPGSVQVLPIIQAVDRSAVKQVASPPLPASIDISSQNIQNKVVVKWIINPNDQSKYDGMFDCADLDRDGFVNGMEIKDIFLQSGLPQPVLAHIWNLCDIKQNGRLNSEQFALAMYLVQQRVQGIEPPATLSPEMMPPSFRPKSDLDSALIENGSSSVPGNSELDLIAKDIEELTKEKQQLENDITQKEADIRIKNGEIKMLSGELTTLTATLKQLETQKGEAQKRLDDLDSQRTDLDRNLDDLKKQMDEELEKVNNLKKHLNDQEVSLKTQEEEVVTKRNELTELKVEESKLELNIQAGKSQFDTLHKNLQDTLLQISQTKAKITQLQEYNRQLTDATALYDSAISNGDVSNITDSTFKLQPMFMEAEYCNLSTTNANSGSGFSVASSGFEDDPFKGDPFADNNGFANDPFVSYDPFKEDPFKAATAIDPFGKPFETAQNDPFKDTDPFSGAFSLGKNEVDPFGSEAFNNKPSSSFSNGEVFENDPFGPPPVAPRNESPTPVLPPKKSKQPPPRPAPPKSSGNKTRAAPPAPSPDPFADSNGGSLGIHRGSLSGASNQIDPFASAFGNDPFEPFGTTTSTTMNKDPFTSGSNVGDGFANFADFDNKFSKHILSEEEQLAWAKKESVLERDRQKRAAEREQADLDLALALSKAEAARRVT